MEADGGINRGTTVSTEVVRHVASEDGVAPDELPPLYDALDPEALDRLLTSFDRAETDGATAVTFSYAGYRVTVGVGGDVSVSSLD